MHRETLLPFGGYNSSRRNPGRCMAGRSACDAVDIGTRGNVSLPTGMTRSLQAIFENGILRPLEPLPFKEHQQVTVTVSDQGESDALDDASFLRHLEADADDQVTLEQVRSALSNIRGSMTQDFRDERDDRT
jgi:predicted DNA-binding antitoxin AbrB/MazE fold protein